MKIELVLHFPEAYLEVSNLFAEKLGAWRDSASVKEGPDWALLHEAAVAALVNLQSGLWKQEELHHFEQYDPQMKLYIDSGAAGFRRRCEGPSHLEELVVTPMQLSYAVLGSRVTVHRRIEGGSLVIIEGRRGSLSEPKNETGGLARALLELKIKEVAIQGYCLGTVRVETQSTGLPREPWNLLHVEMDAIPEEGDPHMHDASLAEHQQYVAGLKTLNWRYVNN